MKNKICVTFGLEYPNHKISCKDPVSEKSNKKSITFKSE